MDGLRAGLELGATVHIADRPYEIVRCDGTDDRPRIRLAGVDDARTLHGELMLVDEELEEGEYLASDLVGCEVPGLGRVERVLDAPSCPLLEVGDDGFLVPLIGDAVTKIDLERRVIEVDREFLGY